MKKILALLLLLSINFSVEAASKKSYSGSNSSYTTKSFSGSSSSSKPSTTKSFSGSSSTTKPATPSASKTSYSAKPSKTTFDSSGGKEQQKVESRQQYNKGTTAKQEYKTPTGNTVKIDPKDTKIQNLRSQLDHQKWVNRDMRQQQFYGSYYSRPVVFFNDPYPSFFWWWLLDRSLDERAMWAYHHRHDMDQARYNSLLSKDAQLEAKIRQLEQQGIKRDVNYTPAGVEPDLMYSNEYVDAAYNPAGQTGTGGLAIFLWICLGIFVIILVWFVFFRKIKEC